MTNTTAKLSHAQVRQALGASSTQKEMACPVPGCGHEHFQLFGTDGFICRNDESKEHTKLAAAVIRERLDTGTKSAPAATPKPKKLKPSELADWPGFTLDDYCKLKKLNRHTLQDLFSAYEANQRGKTVVVWPYFSEDGKLLATKFRLSHDSHDTFFEPADPHIPYGLNNPLLQNLVPGSYDLVITEGESDCHTLASWGLIVVGISGSQGWLPEYAELAIFQNAKRIFICEDGDDGGKKFVAKILKDLPQALVLRFDGVKDPSELHIKYADVGDDGCFQHPFIESVDIAIQAATLEKALRQPKTTKPEPAPMREEAFYGLAGKLVRLLEPELEASREAILANVLCCTGVLFQREAYSLATADKHYPVDFFLTVGASAIARKGTTTNAVLNILDRVQPGFSKRRLGGLSTGQGLIAGLIKKDKAENTEELPEPIAPAVLIDLSEFAELLAVMKRDESTLSAILRKAWDGEVLRVLTRNNPLAVQNVSLSYLAHITRQELLDKLTSTETANGFANRHIFLWMKRSKLIPDGSLQHLDCNDVIRELHTVVESAKGLGQVNRDSETKLLWAEVYKGLTTRSDSMVDVLLSRAEAHVVRLSLLYALLDGAHEIRKEHLRAALAVWDYSESSVKYIFGHSVDAKAHKIIRKLERSDGPLTEGEIRRLVFNDNESPTFVTSKLEELEQARMVRRCEKQFKTGTKAAWELVE